MRSHASPRRLGFTLIELLVVIVIILVLASFVVAFAPRLAERQKVSRGASLLQQWLATARSRAKRDRVPTGVRLQVDPATNYVTQLQYIQKPDDFTGGQVYVPGDSHGIPMNFVYVQSGSVDFSGGFPDSSLYPVQGGDWIELKGGGLVHLITRNPVRDMTYPPYHLDITLSKPPYPISPTSEYRIIRSPRVLPGEPALDMPKDVAIDLTPTLAVASKILKSVNAPMSPGNETVDPLYPPPPPRTPPPPYYDILFAPSGELVGKGAGQVGILLLVRDTSLDTAANGVPDGEPALIAIYSKTGFIAVHPVNTPNGAPPPVWDYYSFTKDGHSSGL